MQLHLSGLRRAMVHHVSLGDQHGNSRVQRYINAIQKIDESIVCGLGKATLGQVRSFTLMFGPIYNSAIDPSPKWPPKI